MVLCAIVTSAAIAGDGLRTPDFAVLAATARRTGESPFSPRVIESHRGRCGVHCSITERIPAALGNRNAVSQCTAECKADTLLFLYKSRDGNVAWCMGIAKLDSPTRPRPPLENFRDKCTKEVDAKYSDGLRYW